MFGRNFQQLLRDSEQRYEALARELERRHQAFARKAEERYQEQRGITQEQLQITREVIRRNELVFQDTRDVLAQLADKVDAQTKAIFRVLDRLENGGSGFTPT